MILRISFLTLNGRKFQATVEGGDFHFLPQHIITNSLAYEAYKMRWLGGLFLIIILSKNLADVLVTKKRDPAICQNGERRGNRISASLDHKPVTATHLKQNLLLLEIKKPLTFFRPHVQIL